MKTRKHLSASGLFHLVRSGFEKVTDYRIGDVKIDLADALTSAFHYPTEQDVREENGKHQ